MNNRQDTGQQVVAQTASRILNAWETGRSLREELRLASNLSTQGLNTFEIERMEVLESVVQSLKAGRGGASEDELRVAVGLLEHLSDRCVRQI